MEAEIITIGDEILIGQTVDTNSAWLGKQLNAIGIDVRQITSIRDRRTNILQQLKASEQQVDLIIITGGLGPTRDDVTKQVLCEYFNTELIRNPEVLKRIEHFFTSRGREMLESNRRQADLPQDSILLGNNEGTASGMWFEKAGKIFISLPGVPYEMKHIAQHEAIPRLRNHFQLPFIVHHTVMTEGIGESFLAERIKDWEDSLESENIKIAYLPSPGIVKIRLSAYGNKKEKLQEKIKRKVDELQQQIPNFIFGENDEKLEQGVVATLIKNNLTLATAESCTGGYIAHLITSIPGSSACFLGSVVSYSNAVKMNELNVKAEEINKHGAVSESVVVQMATQLRKKYAADIGIATSGIAGPSGGSDEKPVGTVWIAIATKEGVYAKKFLFEKNRSRNIQRSAYAALSMVRRYLNNQLKVGL